MYELEKVINENKTLILSICKKYKKYNDIEDLYHEGVIGLIKAYNNYDSKRDVKFSTYAFPYIVGEVNTFIRENRDIKITKDLARLGKKIKEYINKYYEKKGYRPSYFDIASMLNISERKVMESIECFNMVSSLDKSINKDGKEITLLDITPTKEGMKKDDMIDLKDAYLSLTNEEKELVRNRYFKDLTQEEFAGIIGTSQVYVSRLEKKALSKMKKKMQQSLV